jgi:hypothetical protein
MSLSVKNVFLSATLALSLPLTAHADSGLAVPAIIGATLGSAIAGSIYGEGFNNVVQSGIGMHQTSIMSANDDGINTAYLTYRLEGRKALWQHRNFVMLSGIEASVGQWAADSQYPYHSVTDVGLTPIFTIKSDETSPWYLETGIGAHYISDVHIRTYSKSTQFQFGDQFGFGWENQHFRIGYKFLHVSNANIELPNPATEFNMIEVGYRY